MRYVHGYSPRESILQAWEIIKLEKLSNVIFLQVNIFKTGFFDEVFDHIFLCFVLEHLDYPLDALVELKRVLKPGGSITVIEGDHGSCFWYPETEESLMVWQALIKAQEEIGHDPLIGRQLHPLLDRAGLKSIMYRRDGCMRILQIRYSWMAL